MGTMQLQNTRSFGCFVLKTMVPQWLTGNKLLPWSPTTTSSETQGQSVGPGEKARRKLSSMGGRALGYRLSPDHFQTVKGMLASHWAQKMLCIIVPNPRTFCPEFVHDSYFLATVARFVYQAFLTRNEGTTDESKTFPMLSAGAIQFAVRKFCLLRITMYRK